MTKQQVANEMLKDFPWDGTELAVPLTLPGALLAPSYVEQKQIATPANPPTGSLRLYPKADGKYYQLDSAGNESIISGQTQAQNDARYLPLTGGTLTGPLTVVAGVTAQSLIASGTVAADGVVANTYKWTPASDGESLYKEMPGRLRLSGAMLTVDQNLNVGSYEQFAEIASPVTPNTGFLRLYGKSDHNLYIKDTSGAEYPLLTRTLADARYDTLGAATTGDTAHVAAADPHPVYLTAIEGDARYATNPGGPSGGYLTISSADATYLKLAGGTLTGNLLFSADNTHDIGAAAASRPRDLFLGRNANVVGNITQPIGASTSLGRTGIGTTQNNTDPGYDLRVNGAVYIGGTLSGSGPNLSISMSGVVIPSGSGGYQFLDSNHGLFYMGSNVSELREYGGVWQLTKSVDSTSARITLSGSTPATLGLSGGLSIGSANERIRNPVNLAGSLSIESADGYVFTSGATAGMVSANAYYDGTNWQRFNVANAASYISTSPGAPLTVAYAPSGANPIVWNSVVASIGTTGLITATGLTINGNINLNGDIYATRPDGTGVIFLGSGNHYVYWSGANYEFGSPVGPIHVSAANVDGAVTAGTVSGNSTYARSGYLHTTDGSNGIVMSDNGAMYVRGANGQVYMDGGGGLNITAGALVVAGTVNINGNQFYLNGVGLTQETARGYGALMTNTGQGDFVLGGGSSILYMHPNLTVYIQQAYPYFDIVGFTTVRGSSFESTSNKYYFESSHAVSITWNGTYLNNSHSIQFNTTGNQIVWPNGSYISGNAGYVQGSSRMLKVNAFSVSDSELLATVSDQRLPVSSYLWPNQTKRNIGFMADDIASVLPEQVIRDENGVPAGYNPQELTVILWGAVRALAEKVAILEGVTV